jgi:hypothetical protein
MKLVIYTLNIDGTIPDYIIDGGHFPYSNNNQSPQDWDFIGVANDDAEQEGFPNKEALTSYVESKGFESRDIITNEIIPLQSIIEFIWSKI